MRFLYIICCKQIILILLGGAILLCNCLPQPTHKKMEKTQNLIGEITDSITYKDKITTTSNVLLPIPIVDNTPPKVLAPEITTTSNVLLPIPIVDNTPPKVLSITPETSRVKQVPPIVTGIFSEPIQAPLSSSLFSVSGCNASIAGVTLSSDAKTATIQLSGSSCMDNDVVTITMNPTKLVDLAGNAATEEDPISRSYTLDTAGPKTTLQAPANFLLSSNLTLSIPITYTGKGVLSAAQNPATGYVVTVTGNVSCHLFLTPAVFNLKIATSSLSISTCTGSGTLSIAVGDKMVQDDLGNLSTNSETLTFTMDAISPMITSMSLLNNDFDPLFSRSISISVMYSEPIQALSASSFTVSSDCSTPPTVGSVTMSSDAKTTTLNLSGGICTQTNKTNLTLDPKNISDLAENLGTGDPYVLKLNKYVFTVQTDGNLGGVSGADLKCMNNIPNTLNTKANFKAFLIDRTNRTIPLGGTFLPFNGNDWPLKASTPYFYQDGTFMGTTDANGVFISTAPYVTWALNIFTGLNFTTDGELYALLDYTCSDWTSSTSRGVYNVVNVVDYFKKYGNQAPCNNPGMYILCVQQ